MIDILMITYNRAYYTNLSLSRLLDSCDENMRVWIWQNGTDPETLEVVKNLADHPSVYEFHISKENKKLNEPTNWLWQNAKGEYLSKVDDDCLVPDGWAQTLKKVHEDNPKFGVIGCWHFREEDFIPELANKKIMSFNNGHQLMRNCWLGGSGYLMKRECFRDFGVLKQKDTFTSYCINLALKGWINGWYYPFIYQEHMDDPRSLHTQLKTQEDFNKFKPLTAINFGENNLDEWKERFSRSSRHLQSASYDPKMYTGWRTRWYKVKKWFSNT